MKFRFSPQRQAILQAVRDSRAHPSARDIHSILRSRFPRLSLGTVYRNLEWLVARGDLRALRLAGQVARFEGVCDDHPHFLCRGCGTVQDLDAQTCGADTGELRRLGYRVESIAMTVAGRCPNCSYEEYR